MHEAFAIQETVAALLLFDDLAGLGRGVGKTPHEAQGNPLGPEAAAGRRQVLHGQLQRYLELIVARHTIGVVLRAVPIGVHVVPHEMPNEWEAIADPHHGLVQVIGVVGVDHRVDVRGDAHLGHVGQAADQGLPGAVVLGDEVVPTDVPDLQ